MFSFVRLLVNFAEVHCIHRSAFDTGTRMFVGRDAAGTLRGNLRKLGLSYGTLTSCPPDNLKQDSLSYSYWQTQILFSDSGKTVAGDVYKGRSTQLQNRKRVRI